MTDFITPPITVDDLPKAVNFTPVPEGTYTVMVAEAKGGSGADFQMRTSAKGNRYLTLRLTHTGDYANRGSVWAQPIMFEGDSATYSSNFAGLVSALGITEAIPQIAPTGEEINGNAQVTLAVNGDVLDLVGRTLKVKLSVETDDNGDPLRNRVASFIPANVE